MKVSDQGLAFLAAHEGFVSRGYLDPVGVVTIGYGFTMRSRVFAAWWRAKHGQRLAVGDSLSRVDANTLLVKLLDEEYAPPVDRALPKLTQTQLDACVSVVYNLGARALSWRWASALKRGQIATAASLLRMTGITASGQRLRGLVTRRAAEARLLESGNYGHVSAAAVGSPGSGILEVQRQLKSLGHDPGPLDGIWGTRTRAALCAFQREHPPLIVDCVPGPATWAALGRACAMQNGTGVVGVITVLTGGGLLVENLSLPLVALGIAGALITGLVGLQLWRHRGAVLLGLKDLLSRA